ncbi:FAD-dependent oxidoreductase [Caulobacter sp. D4A]|uniref:FAD-dependent oxidoreductase n=1 Tax=unclassified Caulobacter TaxID=2648921 RepID=UPI000D72DE03|nr:MULTISPECIES: FAD-dependent oxidoreductase [unclassified Caulobacter]PXA73790.1 FAD-dependent oxidoreductase [Caulobacter sp. D4A]PXA95901.1 FAD-dependent oxidoreductase [Caulobacter sp. D5]
MGEHVETLVIGAGPAGLSAAHALACAGRTVTVIEADAIGGAARTLSFDGFSLDVSGRRLSSADPAIRAFWTALLPNDLVEAPSAMRLEGERAARGRPGAAIGALLTARLRPIANSKTLGEWLTRRFGRRVARRLGDYAHKLWALRPEETPAQPACPSFQSESGSLPRLGTGQLWDSCAQVIRAAGGEILLGRKATGLRRDRATGVWTVTAETGQGTTQTLTADQVISTMPLRELMGALSPTPISLFHACELMYRDQVTVAFAAKPGRRRAPALAEIHDPQIKAARARALDGGALDGGALALDYYCFEGDATWVSDDGVLIAQAVAEAGRLGLIAPGSARDVQVVRQRKVHPIHDECCDEHLKMIGLDLRLHFTGLHLAGRAGTHGDSADDQSIRTGLSAAANVLARVLAPVRVAA